MNIYQLNIQKHNTTILKLAKVLSRLSILRLIVFIFSASLITILANERLFIPIIIITPLCALGFGLVIKRYNKTNRIKRHTTFLKEINEAEILRSNNKLSAFESGKSFIKRDHPYISDLDIFGSHSLFQLLNRTTTESGQILLAKWLLEPADMPTILNRQEAVSDLSTKIVWRQDFQAIGMQFKNDKSDYNKLLTWIEKPVLLLPHQYKYLIISILLSLLSTAAAAFFIIHVFEADWYVYCLPLLIVLLINHLVIRGVRPISEEIIESTQYNIKVLGGYQSLINKIESENFHSAKLQRLQSTLSRNGYSAASEINKLKKILEIFQLRGTKADSIAKNQFYSVLNIFWLLDIYWIILTEKWKQKNKSYLKGWALAVSEFEVLSSIAGFHYSNPSFNFPEIKEEPYQIHFELLGHPLIDIENRICNNFHLTGRGEIAMITGSNMAGKSTFLRTVGVNLVLALMGAPCCTKSGQVSNLLIFTSMRTQDNLQEGVSSFYAELKRIELLLQLIESGKDICFLLDEMFKGTNSQDRHKGGVSLIKQLSELNAFGIISTHDLELAKLAGNHMIVANYSFNSEIQQGEMTFNYQLTQSICRDFNASELMKRSGINVLSNIDKL